MFNQPVVFVDIETTGISYHSSRILEIAAIRVEDDQVVDEFRSLVNPGTPVPRHITGITGITASDVVHEPYFADIAAQLSGILHGAIFAAHNVRFDLSFVKRQLEACGYPFAPKLLCTVRLSRALYPDAKGHSLAKLIERHNLQVNARHRAYDDARVLWDFCQLAHAEAGPETFAAAVDKQLKTKTLPPNLQPEQMETLTNEPGVYIFEDATGAPIYVGKSVSVRNRVLSHFTQDTKVTKEMKLSQAAHGLRVMKTAGELEALLLESRLVKELLPLYNKQLRRTRQQVILQKQVSPDGYTQLAAVVANLAELDTLDNVYGVYPTRRKAKEALVRAQHTFALCPKLLGLEHGRGACFQYHLRRCRGACLGYEAPDDYNQRVELALERSKIEQWPYNTPVIISEQTNSGSVSGVIVDQWCVVGKVKAAGQSRVTVENMKKLFDIDTYKILRSFILSKKDRVRIVPLPDRPDAVDMRALLGVA